MPSAQEARDARRRKILGRGSDRLAFIAGELPSISSPTLQSVATTPSGSDYRSPTTAPDLPLIRFPGAGPSKQTNEVQQPAGGEFDYLASARVIKHVHQQHQAIQEVQDFHKLDGVPSAILGSSQTEGDGKSTSLDQHFDRKGFALTKGVHLAMSLLTWDGVGRSIDVTQNCRASGALSLAVYLVAQSLLFCVDVQGGFFSNWVLPWPVSQVILTDISLVFGALLLGFVRNPRVVVDVDIDEVSTTEDQLSQVCKMSGQLEWVLEAGAVFLKTFQAVFLDCSIYVVVLTSGYSLVENWQSAFCTVSS